ncbi:hypothetical protein TOL_1385 [Thalassolituus oleivorans MIL-1]|uniref:Lipoprotein n=2 Tax=Thalassolituus oleivorans TaxID=187493 RepID=M5DPD6_9GAMM|nr:hypothetical protein TOL_1385 [Thalassolituus oleivorans MIL-1]
MRMNKLLYQKQRGSMKLVKILVSIGLGILVVACSTASFNKAGSYKAESRGIEYGFAIYATNPGVAYKELGVIEFSGDFFTGKLGGPDAINKLRKMSMESVCSSGANTLLASDIGRKGNCQIKSDLLQIMRLFG